MAVQYVAGSFDGVLCIFVKIKVITKKTNEMKEAKKKVTVVMHCSRVVTQREQLAKQTIRNEKIANRNREYVTW